MINIKIKTIPHRLQRYKTVGDWLVYDGQLVEILISVMMNRDYEMAVAVHELIEAHLCGKRGITSKEVDEWDNYYEKVRIVLGPLQCGCKITATSEPGNDKHAPYFEEHQFATKIEKMFAKQMKMDWKEYGKKIDSL